MNRLWLAIVLASTACANTSYLAKVNGDKITPGDLRREFGMRHAAMENYLSDEKDVRNYLENAIDRRLLVQEAERIGLQDLPEVRAVLEETHAGLMVRLLLKREIDEKHAATEAEIKAAYDMGAETLKVREIAVATRQEAEKVRARILAGEDMGDLAKELSLAKTAKTGGLLEVSWGLDEAWEKYVLPLAKGATSEVFPFKNRWQVVRVEDRVKSERPPLEKVKVKLRGNIEQRKRYMREQAFLAEMRAKYKPVKLKCDVSVASLKKALDAKKDETSCATWMGGRLTLHDYASSLNLELLAAEPAERYPQSIDAAIDDLLAQEYLLAEATARGYASDPQVSFEEATRRERVLSDLMLERYVLVNATPSDDEVRKHMAAHPEEQVVPEMRKLNRFAVRTRAEMDAARRELADGEDFAAVQEKVAAVPRSSGVIIVKKGAASPELAPVFAAKKGEVVGPVELKGVFYLGQVLEITPERKMGSEEAFAQTQERLFRERGQKAYKEWTGKLRAKTKIQLNERGIRAYLKAHPAPKIVAPSAVSATHGISDAEEKNASVPPPLPLPRPAPATPAAPAVSPQK